MSDDTNEYIIEPDNSSGNSSPQSNDEPVSDENSSEEEESEEEERYEVDEYTDVNYHHNQLKKALAENVTSTPSDAVESQFWYDKTNKTMKFFNGEEAVNMGQQEVYEFVSPGLTDDGGEVSLDLATTSTKGGVIIGTNIDVNNGVISVKDSTNAQKGLSQFATDTEANLGLAENKTINPKQLATRLSALGSEIESDIAALELTVDGIGTRLTTAEGNITSLGTRMSTAEGKITTLENAVSGVETLLHTINSGGN